MYTYLHIYIHISICTYIYIFIYTYLYNCTHIYYLHTHECCGKPYFLIRMHHRTAELFWQVLNLCTDLDLIFPFVSEFEFGDMQKN